MTATPGDPAGRAADPPARALAALLAGNRRFAGGHPRNGHRVATATAGDQRPCAVVLGCIDSRVPPEAVFDQDFGAVCVVRSGGHALDGAVRGSVEFAVAELGAALVMVLGHERCGAVQATVEAVRAGVRPEGAVARLVDAIAPAVREVGGGPGAASPVPAVTRAHVRRTVAALHRSGRLRPGLEAGAVAVVGAVYDLDSGAVTMLTDRRGAEPE